MLTRPNIYGGDIPFLLIHETDRDEAVRFFASAGYQLIITTEGTSLMRIEFVDASRHEAARLVEQLMRRSRAASLLERQDSATAVEEEMPGAFFGGNRLQQRGLLDE